MTTRACVGEAGIREALHDRREQAGRDLEVEHRRLRAGHRRTDSRVGGGVGEVALHVAEPRGEAGEHRLVELLARADDRRAGALDELVDRPVIHGDPDDGAVEQSTLLEPVERPEGHHPRQVAGDPEDHEHVAVRVCAPFSATSAPSFSCRSRSSCAAIAALAGQFARRPLRSTGSTNPDPWSSW